VTYFHFIHCELEVCVSSLSHYTVILKIMFASLLCMILFDMVLYCLTYQLLICFNFVDSKKGKVIPHRPSGLRGSGRLRLQNF